MNDNSEEISNLPSTRDNNNNKYINTNGNIKHTHNKSPKFFEETKYILQNIQKGHKSLNFSELNTKKINTNYLNINQKMNSINSNYINPSQISSRIHSKGINLVGLNEENNSRKNSMDGIYPGMEEGNNNLKLERLGIPSPNSQKPKKNKIKLQGLSTEAPLKISAAFGRTAYTFIDKNNTKKLYTIKVLKKKPENEKFDVYFGRNENNN